MRRTILGCLAATAIAAGVAAPADAASTPGCVKPGEFHRVHNGMTQTQVQRIFGAKGRVTWSWHGHWRGMTAMVDRQYRICGLSPDNHVEVNFANKAGAPVPAVYHKNWHRW